MQESFPPAASAELADAIFQAIITTGLAFFALALWRRVRERWFAWWAAAWALYVLRLGAIIAFLASGNLAWLFWHQVITGWVALAILWAALVFSRDAQWRPWYLALALLPFGWAWVAVNGLDQFLLVESLSTPHGCSGNTPGAPIRGGHASWRSRSLSGDCTTWTIPSCGPVGPGSPGATISTSSSSWPLVSGSD
jgi:hypothetical protein